MQKEPVLVILNGLAAAIGAVLIALNITHVTAFDVPQTAAIVGAVAAVCNLAALAIRAVVVSPQTNADQVATARAELPPGAVRYSGGVSGATTVNVTDGKNIVFRPQNPQDGR